MASVAGADPVREALYARQRGIDSDLSEASRTVGGAESDLASVDSSMGTLASRLAAVRGKGYAALAHLDKSVDLLVKKWAEVGPSVRQAVATNLQPLRSQIASLQSEAQSLRSEIDAGRLPAAESLAGRLSGEASSVRIRASEEVARAAAPLKELSDQLGSVDRDLKIAEATLGLFGQAAFPLQQGEAAIFAVEGKMMEGSKSHGTLYFTNHRFVFEGLKEVVLEKKLFIVTKKRIERVVEIERPVGAVHAISKGRVGLLAGTGVFVEFKPEVGLPLTPIDVRAWEADVITRFFGYITGGEAERDIATVRGVAVAPATIKLVRCNLCGAPHTGEIYQGQVSVKCEYCGSAMAIG